MWNRLSFSSFQYTVRRTVLVLFWSAEIPRDVPMWTPDITWLERIEKDFDWHQSSRASLDHSARIHMHLQALLRFSYASRSNESQRHSAVLYVPICFRESVSPLRSQNDPKFN